MENALENGLSTVATFVPKLILFLVILVVGWLVAKALAKVVDAVLERVGFDRAVERGAVAKAMESSTYDASDVLAKIVYYAVLLFALQLAFGVFGPNPISDLLTGIIAFLPRAFVAIVIVILAAAIAAGAKSLVENTLGGLSYGKVLANVAGVFILGLGIIAALNQVGIATTVTMPVLIAVLATVAGILVVGVGGGLVRPMQSRWERYLARAEAEAPRIRAEAEAGPSVSEQARAAQYDLQQRSRGAAQTTAPTTSRPASTTGATAAAPTAVYDQSVRPASSDADRRV
ncbi:MAG: mechanosensitive ion channel family protein [Ornithinibacter sp.]